MLAVADGCNASFNNLYRLTNRRLLGSILQFVRRPAQAEEILQEVYIKAWLKRTQFDPSKGHAVYWLTRIARRCAIDNLRAAGARPMESVASDDEETYGTCAASDETPLETYASKQRSIHIQAGLNGLAKHYRDSVWMAFFEDLTHDEISLAQGFPLGTVKSRIRRGLRALRTVLNESTCSPTR